MQILDMPKLETLSRTEAIQPPALYGEDLQIASLVRRVRKLIKGAESAPDAIIWRGCQIATMHRLDIFSGDIWIYPAYEGCKPEDWIVDVGIAAWRRAAQRQAKYNPVFTLLSDEETAARIGENYTREDVGVQCALYRLDVARECKALDIPYAPTITFGFWRKQARLVKKDNRWTADQLANTETKLDKAQKRAEKKALRVAFSLDYPDEQPVDLATSDWRVATETERKINQEERINALPATPNINREENGEMLWA